MRLRSLARASLSLVAVASSSLGCLITSTPNYQDPQRTPPTLVDPKPSTTIAQVVYGNSDMGESQELTAGVISEDAGIAVAVQAYVDYGADQLPLSALRTSPQAFHVAPGSISDGVRFAGTFTVRSSVFDDKSVAGCHTVTLFATHGDFTLNGCPKCLADSSSLTWQVVNCGDGVSQCDPSLTCSPFAMQDWVNVCTDDPSECPEPSSGAGGGGQ